MIHITVPSQPDGETCGPTALYALYRHYGLHCTLEEITQSVKRNSSGGTLAPYLGQDALARGFDVTLYINNIDLFDPTWFINQDKEQSFLMSKLEQQLKFKDHPEFIQTSQAYIHFLMLGGIIKFEVLNKQLIKSYFENSIPILAGLSATYLYQTMRYSFHQSKATPNDLEGTPCGHFVILCGYDQNNRVIIADPNEENPISHAHYYSIKTDHLFNAIMMGVLTQDGNLLIIQPKQEKHANHPRH